jgi:hypothetical protein
MPAYAALIDRERELNAALVQVDTLKRSLHSAQVRGDGDREQIEAKYEPAVSVACLLRETETNGIIRGLRLGMELYEAQVRQHLGLDDILERIDAIETVLVAVESGVRT